MYLNWLLYICLVPYVLVDHFQTVALIELGYEELNPFVLWVIGTDQTWDYILIVKVALLTTLGLSLLYLQIKNNKQRR